MMCFWNQALPSIDIISTSPSPFGGGVIVENRIMVFRKNANLYIIIDMNTVIDYMFSPKELEKRTSFFYRKLRQNRQSWYFCELFEEVYGISYEVAYKNLPTEKGLDDLLYKYYRNEYCIKHEFIRQILNRSGNVNYDELPVDNSRTDLFMVNKGIISTYEIKTGYDTLNRLPKQLKDYSKFFDFLFVVCEQKKLEGVLSIIPSYCGVYSYVGDAKKLTFHKEKEAQENPLMDIASIVNEMWKPEKEILFGTTNKEEIEKVNSSNKVSSCFAKAIQKRYQGKWNKLKLCFDA